MGTLPLVYLVRHGQTDWNVERRLQGQADTDINAVGRAQATANGELLGRIVGDADRFDFVASPLRRTRETMERIRAAMGLAPDGYRTDERLKEIHFGDWQGFTYPELELHAPGSGARRASDKWHFLPPGEGAESYATLTARVADWLSTIERPTICVAHGGIVRAAFRVVGGLSAEECAVMDVPQDRVLRIEDGELEWLGGAPAAA
jgi:probable phosphoglycerate mutase